MPVSFRSDDGQWVSKDGELGAVHVAVLLVVRAAGKMMDPTPRNALSVTSKNDGPLQMLAKPVPARRAVHSYNYSQLPS